MAGFLLTFAIVLLASRIGTAVISRIKVDLDPAETLGLSALLGLGFAGLVTLALGYLPGGRGLQLPLFLIVLGGLAIFGGRPHWGDFKFRFPHRPIALVAIVLLLSLALVGVFAPSDMRDWDSLAYHLAVPKIWLNQGHVSYIPGIHHSNFPFTADMLYVWGLDGENATGAKAFSFFWTVAGCVTLFGVARRWFGDKSAWLAPLALVACPVVLWEAGTAYIDVPHGLFCGLAVLYLADALKSRDLRFWLLCGLTLGFALGTKHTGLQTIAAIAGVGTLAFLVEKPKTGERRAQLGLKGLAISIGIGLVLACPWYIKSIAMTGNPVYPFFYKQLGGKDWNVWRSEIYTNEQKSFGVGSNPTLLGHAVFGLAYQPGRYVNPGQSQGGGFPTGSIGFLSLVTAFLICCKGSLPARSATVLASIGLSLLFWFVLSQQSRYLISIVVPMCVLAAGAFTDLKWNRGMAVCVSLQATCTAWIVWTMQTTTQLPVVFGSVTRDQYEDATVPFHRAAKVINALPGVVKVALYDEVFGFYCDQPYMWANPGHSTLIPYETSDDAQHWIQSMKQLGFTHAYANVSASAIGKDMSQRWADAMSDKPFGDQERKEMRNNPDLWWRVLFADAVREGLLKSVQVFPEGSARPKSVLFELER